MVIEMAPYIGGKELNAGTECGRRCHNEDQESGIKRIDVAKMDDGRPSTLQFPKEINYADESNDDQENERMDV